MDNIEILRQNYYEAINLLQDEQDIINALPTNDFQNFFPLIIGLIAKLEVELQKLKDELSSSQNEHKQLIRYINEEIEITNKKISICQKKLEEAKKEETTIEEFGKRPIKNIVFATTPSDNVCLENDLKVIPEEFYQEIIDMLEMLENGITENNAIQAHSFNSSHQKLYGCHEVKAFKIRVIYKILSSDTVYILLAKLKKSDNDSRDREEIVVRANNQNHQYELLKEQLKNPQIKDTIIKEHRKILTNIYDYLNKKKRGRNGE